MAHSDARIDRHIECAGHAEILRWYRGQRPGEGLLDPRSLAASHRRVHHQEAQCGRPEKSPDQAVTHCSFDLEALASTFRRGEAFNHARANSRYHSMYPVCVDAWAFGPFFPSAADPCLP